MGLGLGPVRYLEEGVAHVVDGVLHDGWHDCAEEGEAVRDHRLGGAAAAQALDAGELAEAALLEPT